MSELSEYNFARAEAKKALQKARPLVLKLLSDPSFEKRLETEGYKINIPGLIEFIQEGRV